MVAKHPSNAFQAFCSVIHNSGSPPELAPFSWGFSAVELNTDISPTGVYLLTLDFNYDFLQNNVAADYKSNESVLDFGVMFDGRISALIPGPNQICLVRFQVIPGNILKDGPFTVSISSTI